MRWLILIFSIVPFAAFAVNGGLTGSSATAGGASGAEGQNMPPLLGMLGLDGNRDDRMWDALDLINSNLSNAILYVTIAVVLLPALVAIMDFLRRKEQATLAHDLRDEIKRTISTIEIKLTADSNARLAAIEERISKNIEANFGDQLYEIAEKKAEEFYLSRDISQIIRFDLQSSFFTNELQGPLDRNMLARINQFNDIINRISHSSKYDFLDTVRRFDTQFGRIIGLHTSFLSACLILSVDYRTRVKGIRDRNYLKKLVKRLCENADITVDDLEAYLSEDFGLTKESIL